MKKLCLLLLLLFIGSCSNPPAPATDPGSGPAIRPEVLPPAPVVRALPKTNVGTLRIGLIPERPDLHFELLGACDLFAVGGQKLGTIGAGMVQLRATSGGMSVRRNSKEIFKTSESILRFLPRQRGANFAAKGNQYGGEFFLLRASAFSLSLIQQVELEEYLRGVVPWEIGRPPRESLAAVEAQAVAARTYAASHAGRHAARGFDLLDDVNDQVYHGLRGTHPVCDEAISKTRGKVATFRGKAISAYYSSTCGGQGASIEEVWQRGAQPYLVGRPDKDTQGRSWCADSRHFRWREQWSARQLGDLLREHLPTELGRKISPRGIGTLQEVKVLERDPSGRVKRILFRTDRERFVIMGDRVRWVMRPMKSNYGILRSSWFELQEVRGPKGLEAVRIRGGGFGHGIGMCQVGALARARAGQSMEEILRHYYPGIRIESLSSLR